MSAVNYLEISKGNVTDKHTGVACYSKVFRQVPKGVDTLIMFEPSIKIKKGVDGIQPWIDDINKMGFPCEYLGYRTMPEYNIKQEYYIFKIDLKKYKYKNHMASTLTLLRYLYESDICRILDHYFKIKEKYKSIKSFTALKIANILYGYGNGHTLHNDPLFGLLTRREVLKNLKSGPTIRRANYTSIQKCWSSVDKIKINAENKSIKEIKRKMEKNETCVYVVGGDNEYANWVPNCRIVKELKNADLVIFTGGEDVDPSLYNEPMGFRTFSNLKRDLAEKEIYKEARKLDKPMLGICRGAQFLCVMNGGKLVQHQENPEYIHEINTTDYGKLKITSTHHQAAYPYNLDRWYYKVIGYTLGLSKIHLDGNANELDPAEECEIVYYRMTKCLGIQGHPEHVGYQQQHPESLKTLQNILFDFLNNRL